MALGALLLVPRIRHVDEPIGARSRPLAATCGLTTLACGMVIAVGGV